MRILFLFLILLTACEQIEINSQTLEILKTLSISDLQKAFESQDDDFFEEIILKSKITDKEIEALRCQREGLPLTPEMQTILLTLDLDHCSGCKPLVKPSCDDKKCTCSKICPDWCQRVCPDSSAILKQLKSLSIPFKENLFVVPDLRKDFGLEEDTDAYTYGVLALKKKMTALSKFKPNEKPKDENGVVITDQGKLSEYYGNILAEIHQGKVQTIPGFSSINDFVSTPFVSNKLKEFIRFNIDTLDSNLFRMKSNQVIESNFIELKKIISMNGSAAVISSDEEGKKKIFDIYHIYPEKRGDETWIMGCQSEIFPSKEDYISKASWKKKDSSSSPYCPKTVMLTKKKKGKSIFQEKILQHQGLTQLADNLSQALTEKCRKEMGCE